MSGANLDQNASGRIGKKRFLTRTSTFPSARCFVGDFIPIGPENRSRDLANRA
jgi:hypothetical protein